jgi:hypothetical protein
MRRLSLVVLLALLAGLLPAAAGSAYAASVVVNETGSQPGTLNPGYQFTASADTAFGQGVTVELNPVGSNDYTRKDCYYLNGSNLPAGTTARFRCDTTATPTPASTGASRCRRRRATSSGARCCTTASAPTTARHLAR